MKVDYIIVGSGLAGIAFCEQLKAHNKTFFVFDNGSQQSSLVAGGLYNPVILNRFTKVWRSREPKLMFWCQRVLYVKLPQNLKAQILKDFYSL